MYKLTITEMQTILDWYASYEKEHPPYKTDIVLKDQLEEFIYGKKETEEIIEENLPS